MNQIAETPAHPDNIANRQLVTIDPVQYVAAVFHPFQSQLQKAIAESHGVQYDVKTTDGMATAVEWRRRFREIRVSAEKERKTRKAPILEIGKLLDSTFKELEAEVEKYETGHDLAIKFEEAEKDRIRQEKIKAEEARINGLHKKVGYIINQSNEAVGKTSAQIADLIVFVTAIKVDADTFEELAGNAALAKTETLERLERMREAAEKNELEAARLKQEREELRQRQKEQDERERVARAKLEADEAAAKAVRDAEEARLKAERDAESARIMEMVAAEQASLANQRAVLAEHQRQIEEAQAKLNSLQPPSTVEEKPEVTNPDDSFELTPLETVYIRPTNEELAAVIAQFFSVPVEIASEWLFGGSNV